MKLDDFLKVKQVRCVDNDAANYLTIGKVYQVLGVNYDNTIKVLSDTGSIRWYLMGRFEPVIDLDSAENPLQNAELTPGFEAVDPKFKVGDKVYIPGDPRVLPILFKNGEWFGVSYKEVNPKYILHATPENYALLSQLYPHIKFEAPPKP